GLLEAAHGGTLFLDELAEMPKSIQAKLLRVIQDGVVRRVGSETTDAVVNVRFIAATNGDPEAAVTAGDMREDLYYRLRVVPINVPALRERPEDVPLLADYFLSTYWVRHRSKGAPFPRLTDAALRALCSCAWRGNVRELQNVIEHVAVVVEPGADIRPEDLHLTGDPTPQVTGANPASLISTLLEESYHAARDRAEAGARARAPGSHGLPGGPERARSRRGPRTRPPVPAHVHPVPRGSAAAGSRRHSDAGAEPSGRPDLQCGTQLVRHRERCVGARPRRQSPGGPLAHAVLGGRDVRLGAQHDPADRRGEGPRCTAGPPRAGAARGAGARVVARAAEPRHQRREVHRYGLRGAGGAAHGQQASRVLGPGHRPGVRPRPAPLAVSARAAGICGRAPPLLQLLPGARDLPQAREGHGHGAPGGNAAEFGSPFLLRSRVSLARRCGVMTLPRVTLPRVVARGLQTTPSRHVAPAPHATPQTETSSEPVSSVTQVSGRARARTLPRAP